MTTGGVHRNEMFEDDPLLTAFAQDLRAAADAVPVPEARADLAAVLEGLIAPTIPAWVPAPPRRRRSLTLRWTIAGAAFGLGVGSLGVAGALPAPVQRQLSHFGDVVGVDLPDPARGTPATTVVPTSIPPAARPPQATTNHGRGSDDDVSVDDGDKPATATTEDRDQGDDRSAPNGGDDVGGSDDHPTADAADNARARDKNGTEGNDQNTTAGDKPDGGDDGQVGVTVPESGQGGGDGSRRDGSTDQRGLGRDD